MRKHSHSVNRPSIPPPSTRRAGHYSGLHPEDHPYQSGLIKAYIPEKSAPQAEPETINLPPAPQRIQYAARPQDTVRVVPRPHQRRRRNIVFLLIAGLCLLLIITATLLLFLPIGRPSTTASQQSLTAVPDQLRIHDLFTLTGRGFGPEHWIDFTYDANQKILASNGHDLRARTDKQGNFTVQIQVPEHWKVGSHSIHATDYTLRTAANVQITILAAAQGEPHLQLTTETLNFTAHPTTPTESQTLTLSNNGGGSVHWQANSDQSWLSISPNSGSFSGRSAVQVTVNRGGLAPGTYSGQLTFRQKEGDTEEVVKVTLKVEQAQKEELNVSPSVLSFVVTTTATSSTQRLTLRNAGTNAIHWSAKAKTGDGNDWLNISPPEGQVTANSSIQLEVQVQATQLPIGSYQGTIQFTNGTAVAVNLSVIAAGNLVVSPPSLTLSTTAGQQTTGASFTLQNSGDEHIQWQGTASTEDGADWLSLEPAQGSLSADEQATIMVHANVSSLAAGTYQGVITLQSAEQTKQLTVTLNITRPATPELTVQPGNLRFITQEGSNADAQSITLTNSGASPLHWQSTLEGTGAYLFSIDTAEGSLPAGKSVTITVSSHVSPAKPGTYTATLVLQNTEDPAMKQTVTLTMIVNPEPTPAQGTQSSKTLEESSKQPQPLPTSTTTPSTSS
ncbi:BACON domain-containing protein [Thermosporothrix hazakensis]|uniref:BACON domain-containing protein n=1 Tax=Thermosporothrix hazakensis TaxID=644383 RepID=UPI0010F53D0D|nr:choice-of-anchor D domain-containing protein [Thermosporothrix hazakensis]